MQAVSEHGDNNEVDDERDRDGDGGFDGSVEVCLVYLGGIRAVYIVAGDQAGVEVEVMRHDDGAHRPGRHDQRLLVAIMAPGQHRAQCNSTLIRQVHNIVDTETEESNKL